MPDEQNNVADNEPGQDAGQPAGAGGAVNQPAAQGGAAPAAGQQQQQQGGGFWRAPLNDAPPSSSFLFGTLTFLLLLMIALLYGITAGWPVCELPQIAAAPPPSPAATAVNTNANTNATVNANTNATTNANANINANVNANTNANVNTNVNANTNANVNTNVNTNANTAAPAGAAAQAKLDIDDIEPKSGPILGNTQVTIKGKGFTNAGGLVVKFGEDEARIREVKPESISVRTPTHSEGLVDVSVQRGDESDVLPSVYTYTCPTPSGAGLFSMLIMAGALGGCIHAARSLWWYTGQGTLKSRWMLMYFTLPFIGAAMAMIFSLLIFAGFVSNATGRGESLFIIAVAGLVGMFSQQAALKLTDIANAFFTKPGSGKDADPQESLSVGAGGQTGAALTATSMDKNSGPAAGNQSVTITGTGFTDETTVTFGGKPAAVVKPVTATAITVRTPSGTAGTEVEVEVKTGSQTAKLPNMFKYN